MMAISAGGIGQLDVRAPKASKATKDDTKETDAFASLMNLSATQNKNDGITSHLETSCNEGTEKTSVQAEYDSFKADSVSKQEKIESQSEKVKSDSSTQETQDAQESGDVSKKNQADEMLTDLKESLEEKLGISEEDIESILSSLGIELQDLFNPDAMKSFMMCVQDVTEVDLLIREDLANLLAELTDMVDGLLEKYGFTDEQALDVQSEMIEIQNMTETVEPEVTVISDEQNHEVNELTDKNDNVVIQGQKDTDITGETIKFESAGSDMQQSGQPEETGNQITANLNQAIENALQTDDVGGASTYLDAVQEADVVRQIIDSIRVNITRDTTSLTLQLNPENLGKVQISVANKNGVMQAQIVAETEAAKHAIESSISLLKETFDNHELKVDAIEVMVASYEFFNENHEGNMEENREERASKKNSALNLNVDVDEEILTEDEQLQVTMMKAQGNSVSYSI